MTEQEQKILDYLMERYVAARQNFFRAKRISPCTKDYIHGRWTELREIIVALFGDQGKERINQIENS